MTGQMTRAEKRRLADEYIKRTDPYTHHDFPTVDLRAYMRYVKENNLSPRDVTSEVMAQFVVKNKQNV